MRKITDDIYESLIKNQDLKYRDFSAKLTPTIDKSKFLGVRVPIVRKLAKTWAKDPNINIFLDDLPHKYVEENNLHGLILCTIKDYNETINKIDEFLPFVDNWATCDIISPKCFAKNKDLLKKDILRWIKSDKTYTIRFGIEMAMTHFLDEDFDLNLSKKISKIRNDEYYVKMMVAWYFATALAKQWDQIITFIESKCLDTWTHNKTIQKAVESYRISNEQKTYLRSLKIK